MTEVQRKAAKKEAAKKIAADPDYFSKLSKRAKRPRGGKASPGSFTKRTGRVAGRKSKRGKALPVVQDTGVLKDHKLKYERTE